MASTGYARPPGSSLPTGQTTRAARLVLLEPANSPYLERIARVARDAGLPFERVDAFDQAPSESCILGIGPTKRDSLQVARDVRRLGGKGLLVFFAASRADRNALEADLIRDPFVYERYELIDLNDGRQLSARLDQVIERVERNLHRPAAARRGRRTRERAAVPPPLSAANEQYLANVLVQANDAIFSTDASGCILTWNGAAERLFGYTGDAIIGKTLDIFEVPGGAEEQQLGATAQRALASGTPQQAELTARHADGHQLNVAVSVAPMHDARGQLLGLSLIARDDSARHRAEEALRDANRQKDEFLAIMSHELRTPLTSILGYTDMLLRGLSGPLQPRTARYISNVRSAGDRLLELVNGLLDYTRLESGAERLDLSAVDLPEVVRTVTRQLAGLGANKGIEMRVDIGGPLRPVRGDQRKLEHALRHYVSNALKFTPAGGWVQVRVMVDPDDQDRLRVVVSDSGIGLRNEQLTRVWERFYQADASLTRAYGGMGLGLSIARHLVRLHGGDVGVESGGPGQGSTFWFSLPAADRTDQAADRAT